MQDLFRGDKRPLKGLKSCCCPRRLVVMLGKFRERVGQKCAHLSSESEGKEDCIESPRVGDATPGGNAGGDCGLPCSWEGVASTR